jgi:hypothetical protein
MVAKTLVGKISNRIIDDSVSKSSSFYIKSVLLSNEDDEIKSTIDDIEKYERVDDVNTGVNSDTSIYVTIEKSLDENIDYNRIYFLNKDDLIMYISDIEATTASEIFEECIIYLEDAEEVLN